MKVLTKIISILDVLSYEESLGAVELAHKVDIPVTTVYRILTELTRHGLLEKDVDTKKYRLGWRIVQFGSKVLQYEQEQFYVPFMIPYLRTLAKEVNETVYLTAIKQRKAVCIAKMESNRNLRYYVEIGKEMPFNCSAAAKALLAFQPEPVKEEIIENMEYIRYTATSICSKEEFIEQLSKIKMDGYAVCDNEIEIGTKAIAVPVFDRDGQVFSSIALVGLNERISKEFDDVLYLLQEFASKATNQLQQDGIEKSKTN